MDYTGKLLIAPPAMKDPFWKKSVILITEDTTTGSMGVILNKKTLSLNEFFIKLGYSDRSLEGFMYLGGPLSQTNLSMLHTSEWVCDNSLIINSELSLSSSDQMLDRLPVGDQPEHFKLFMGLCGWAPSQLESEITGNGRSRPETSWITCSAPVDLIFNSNPTELWMKCLEHSAQEFSQSIF